MYGFRSSYFPKRHAPASRGCHTAYRRDVLSPLKTKNVSQLPPEAGRNLPAEQQPPLRRHADIEVTVVILFCLFGARLKGWSGRRDAAPFARAPHRRGADQRDRTRHDSAHSRTLAEAAGWWVTMCKVP